MKIVHVLLGLRTGGGERMAVDLALGQAARGHRVSVVSLSREGDDALLTRLADARVDVDVVPKRPGLDATLVPRIALKLARRRANVVHTHNRAPLVYGAPAARAVAAKVVHTRHGPGLGSAGEQALRKIAGALVHAYVAVSPTLAELAKKAGDTTASKIHVIENGVDLERFRPDEGARARLRTQLGIPAEAFVFGSVGRLAVEKDYDLLIRAAAPLLGERCHLVFVGDGGERGTLEASTASKGLGDRIHFVGAQRDVTAYLSLMDVFVLSSRMEGLPLAMLEAMANHRAVVSTAVGGIPEVITDGETGLLVPAQDEKALRKALRTLRDDPARARTLALKGRELAVGRYGLERMVEAYLALYRQVGAPA